MNRGACRPSSMAILLVAVLMFYGTTAGVRGATEASEPKLVASSEPGWPQWRGPRRDGVSDETGLLPSWPEGGPKLLWKADGLGRGYSSPIVSKGMIYISGDENDKLHVIALDLNGNLTWKVPNGESWDRSFPGSRATCTYHDGNVYNMNAHGRLVCLDAKDGRELWSAMVLGQYAADNIIWGICESPLVEGGKVFVTPAGEETLMVALDAKTGREIWKTTALAEENPSYASAIMIDTTKGRQIIAGGSSHTFGVDAATGKVLWTYRHEIKKSVILTPSFYQGNVVVPLSSRSGSCTYCLALDVEKDHVEKKWLHEIGNPVGSVVCAEGKVVCASSHKSPGWFCLDAETGKIEATQEKVPYGSAVYADGKFYGLCQDGKMLLLDATDSELRTVSEFQFMKDKRDVWAHPVICDGRLYLRYGDTLYCYDVKER